MTHPGRDERSEPGGMAVDSRLGGRIVNSDGLIDVDVWSKPADWVDYHGPVGYDKSLPSGDHELKAGDPP